MAPIAPRKTIVCICRLVLIILAALFVAPVSVSAAASNVAETQGEAAVRSITASKETLHITCDEFKLDPTTASVICTGNAVAKISGQDACLKAKVIRFSKDQQIVDASGAVEIRRGKEITSGSRFKFQLASDEYLVTEAATTIGEADVSSVKTGDHCVLPLISAVSLKASSDKVAGRIPFISGINFRTSPGAMADQSILTANNPDLANLFGDVAQTPDRQPPAFHSEQQIPLLSVNQFVRDNDKYGLKSYIFGTAAVGLYSMGQSRALEQYGPQRDIRLNRFHLNTGYTQAAIRGSSPFCFDQYLQGSRSINLAGDVKVAKWLRVGGGYGYNLNANAAYAKTLTPAFGRGDFPRGNFPIRAAGWRNGLPAAEPPYTKGSGIESAAFGGGRPWVY